MNNSTKQLAASIAPVTKQVVKRKQGFAVMDPARQREIASLGGRSAHEKGTAHTFNSEEAKAAAKKGAAARYARCGK